MHTIIGMTVGFAGCYTEAFAAGVGGAD